MSPTQRGTCISSPDLPVQIELLQETGIPACAQILIDNPLWKAYGITPEKAEAMLHGVLVSRLAPQAAILAACVNEKIVGFVWYVTHGAWDRSGYIRLIGVAPPYHGMKIGEQLMSAAEAKLAADVRDIFLLVTESNTAAQRFYDRLGYRQVGAIPDYVQTGITELIFHKKLQPG